MLPLLFTAILDGVLLIASIVVAALIGKPLSMLNCAALPPKSDASFSAYSTALPFPTRAVSINKTLSYFTFVAVDQPTCYKIKAVWGLAIALCVLFSFSLLVCVGLWQRARRESADAGNKDIEG